MKILERQRVVRLADVMTFLTRRLSADSLKNLLKTFPELSLHLILLIIRFRRRRFDRCRIRLCDLRRNGLRISDKLLIIELPLRRCKAFVFHLQFQRAQNILSGSEPENHVVALFHASLLIPGFRVQRSELKRPLLRIFTLTVFPQHCDLLRERCTSGLQQLIMQQILRIVISGHFHKTRVVILRVVNLPETDTDLRKLGQNRAAARRTLKRNLQNPLRVIKLPVRLVHIRDHTQRLHTLHTLPVNLIDNIKRTLIVPVPYIRRKFFKLCLIFGLIHTLFPSCRRPAPAAVYLLTPDMLSPLRDILTAASNVYYY